MELENHIIKDNGNKLVEAPKWITLEERYQKMERENEELRAENAELISRLNRSVAMFRSMAELEKQRGFYKSADAKYRFADAIEFKK